MSQNHHFKFRLPTFLWQMEKKQIRCLYLLHLKLYTYVYVYIVFYNSLCKLGALEIILK